MSGEQEAEIEFDSTEVQPVLLQEDPKRKSAFI